MKKKFKLITLLLAFVLLFTPIFSSTVHADNGYEGSGTGSDQHSATGRYAGGPSHSKTGWMVYVVDSDTMELCSPDIPFFYCDSDAPISPIGISTRVNPAWKCTNDRGQIPSYIGKPFLENNRARGAQVKADLLSPGSDGVMLAETFMKDVWGDSFVEDLQMNHKNFVIVLEPVFWYNIYVGGVNSGVVNIGTAYTIGLFQSRVAPLNPYGDSIIGSMTNGIFGTCAMVEPNNKLNIESPSKTGRLSNSSMASEGYGCILIWPNSSSIHTYDGVNSPGAAPETPKGKVNIVKSYHTVNESTGEDTDDGCFIRTSVTNNIIIDDETEYKVEAWEVTTSDAVSIPGTDAGWNPPGTVQEEGNMPGNVEVTLPGKTLFVQLVKKEIQEEIAPPDGYDYVINESQVSRQVYISEAKTNESAKNIKEFQFIWTLPKLKDECSGHDYISEHNAEVKDDAGNVIGHEDKHDTAYCGPFEITDSEINVGLKNNLRNDFKSVLSNSWYKNPAIGDEELQEYDRGQDFSEQEFITTGWDESLVIHRGQDKLTVAEWKGVGLDLANITDEEDMYAVANVPQNNRKSLNYMDTFNIEIKNNSPDVETISAPKNDSGHGICDEDAKDATIDPYMISPLQVYIYVYSGKAEEGFTNTDCQEGIMNSYSGGIHKSWVMLPTGTTFSFFPYIEMRYDTQSSKDNQVYVLSQFRRSISPNDCAEIIWKDGSEGNLTLSSKQWSTNALATSNVEWRQKDSVLPGGAIMNLGIKQSDRQVVTAKTYQVILEGEGRTQAEFAGSIAGMTEADAISYHEQFVSTVMTGLDNLSVEQYVNTSWSSSPFSGQIVSSGCSLSGLDAVDKKASTEDKYYFRESGETAISQEGDLDIKLLGTKTNKYVFSSDTKGNILMNGSVILTQGQDESALSGVAKELDDKTYIVRKLVDAIERNTGSDSAAKNIAPHWYNEAFDGVTVIVQESNIQTGMIDPSERAAVLDPKLCPKNVGQSDLFSKAYSSQFKMKDTSSAYGEKNQIGIFTNMGGSKNVYMHEMENLYKSKVFYIPNVNTQDLSR